jgi:hypothetical protein
VEPLQISYPFAQLLDAHGHVVGDGLHLVGGQLEESLDEVAVDEVVRRDGLAIVLERAPLGVEQAADALDDARLAWWGLGEGEGEGESEG